MVEPPASFDSLLRDGALVVLSLAALWGTAVLIAVLLEATTSGRIQVATRLGCPPRCHRWLLAVTTGVLTVTLAVPPANAEEQRVPSGPTLDGLLLPDRTLGGPAPTPHQNLRAREPPPVSAGVTVLPGDSLWEISRRLLPADAPAGSIADLTRALHLINRTTIGADPDLIHPGQRLVVPPAAHETYSEDS